MKKEYFSVIMLVLLLVFGYYRYKNQEYSTKKTKWILGTQVQISAKSKDQKIDAIIEETFKLMENYENQLSYYKPESELTKINENRGKKVSEDIKELFTISQEIYNNSEKLFDPSIAPVLDLWNFDEPVIPDADSLKNRLKLVGLDKISISENIIEKPADSKLNFGAVAKGYIIDKGIEYLKKNNIIEASINAGGDIRYFSPENKVKIGVKHPRSETNEIIAVLQIANQAVVTSGDYEQFFDLDGKRYHHIISPKTGFPTPNMISVTVIAENATLADALSTAVFLLGPDKGIKLLKQYPNVAGMLYYQKDGEIICLKTLSIKEYLIEEYHE